MDRFEQILWDLSDMTGASLHLDEKRVCKFIVDELFSIQLEMDEPEEHLTVAAKICEVPPGKFRENLFKDALKMNAAKTDLEGTLSYIPQKNLLVLCEILNPKELTRETLKDFFDKFIKHSKAWKAYIESGAPNPATFLAASHQKTSLLGTKSSYGSP